MTSVFVPNAAAAAACAAAAAAAASSSSSSSSAAVAEALRFPAGKHVVSFPPSSNQALDISGLSELHLHHSARLRYFPLVVVLEEDGAPVGAEEEEEEEKKDHHARAPVETNDGSLRVRRLTSYFTLQRRSGAAGGGSGGGALVAKLVSQTVSLSNGQRYAVNEIYSGAGDEPVVSAASGAGAAAAGADAGESSAGTVVANLPRSASALPSPNANAGSGSSSLVSECVVCLIEGKDTAILPCRHLCLCGDCARIIKRQSPPRCPVCRAQVESTVRITRPSVQQQGAPVRT